MGENWIDEVKSGGGLGSSFILLQEMHSVTSCETYLQPATGARSRQIWHSHSVQIADCSLSIYIWTPHPLPHSPVQRNCFMSRSGVGRERRRREPWQELELKRELEEPRTGAGDDALQERSLLNRWWRANGKAVLNIPSPDPSHPHAQMTEYRSLVTAVGCNGPESRVICTSRVAADK